MPTSITLHKMPNSVTLHKVPLLPSISMWNATRQLEAEEIWGAGGQKEVECCCAG